jgi:LuxR family transcriptional regulator, glucitol operon activator
LPNEPLVIARNLYNALLSVQKGKASEAEKLLEEAKRLAPEYFEVYRVDAWLRQSQNNFSAARTSYETAIELEPGYAPLRVWYGGFLLRCLDSSAEALVQYKEAEKIDSDAVEIQKEIAVTSLYLREFDQARRVLDTLLRKANIVKRDATFIYGLHVEFYIRKADSLVENLGFDEAVSYLRRLMQAYKSWPAELDEADRRGRLKKAPRLVVMCRCSALSQEARESIEEIWSWLKGELIVSQFFGTVGHMDADRAFGFIDQDSGGRIYFNRSCLLDRSLWTELTLGRKVVYSLGANDKGQCALCVAPV